MKKQVLADAPRRLPFSPFTGAPWALSAGARTAGGTSPQKAGDKGVALLAPFAPRKSNLAQPLQSG